MTSEDNIIKILTAYKEGKSIQFFDNGKWEDILNPSWNFGDFKYRVKPEPTYRPYNSPEEFMKEAQKHSFYIKDERDEFVLPVKIYEDFDEKGTYRVSLEKDLNKTFDMLLKSCVWANDRTPCGILE